MKIVKTSFDRQEDRRDRRYPMPPLAVLIEDVEYTAVNWSLGGFLISGFAGQLKPGATLLGRLRPGDSEALLRFSGSVVRVDDPEPGFLAVQFTELGENGIEILDRLIARRMFRRRAGGSA